MKIAPLFRAFLESHHYLTLPLIGKFESFSAEVNPLTAEIDKRLVRFTGDAQVKPDVELIGFISKNLKIDTCITESDLNCFCNSVKELFIQGFEAEVPGIGFLHLDTKNQLKFSIKSIYNPALQKTRKKSLAIFNSTFWL